VDDATDPIAPAPPVVAADPAHEAMADAVAGRLGSARLSLDAWRSGAGGPIVVWCDAGGLALRGPAGTGAKPVRPALPDRPRSGHDPLLRAVGPWPSVVDATAGWGVDAATLAAAGREVVLVERHPVLAALLRDVIERGRAAGHPAALRMRLVEADARAWLATAATDVVLLDPMYPEAGDRGARKGEALHLARRLVGDDLDQDQLLAAARRAARRRVVVKRPLRAPVLAGRVPNGTLRGRTVRYDLYAPEEAPP
jgi:16S rRNA (guanine1516-N2)-methyltransferase